MFILFSSQKCQIKDWPQHKISCGSPPKQVLTMWDEDHVSESIGELNICNTDSQDHSAPEQSSQKRQGTDMSQPKYSQPVQLNTDLPYTTITVKANKEKLAVNIQNTWSGTDIMQHISDKAEIPLTYMKLIHKGAVVNAASILPFVKAKAVFQAIGERAESDAGLHSADIDTIMTTKGWEKRSHKGSETNWWHYRRYSLDFQQMTVSIGLLLMLLEDGVKFVLLY